jgi:hypothetical protein
LIVRVRIIVLVVLLTSIIWVPALIFVFNHYRWSYQGHRYQEIDLQELANFESKPGTLQPADIPPQFRALDGQRVLATGYLWMPVSPDVPRVSFFKIVHSNSPRFLGTPVKAQAFVDCTMPSGKTIRFMSNLPVRVWGTMHVAIQRSPDNGIVTSVYQVDVDKMDSLDAP